MLYDSIPKHDLYLQSYYLATVFICLKVSLVPYGLVNAAKLKFLPKNDCLEKNEYQVVV